LRVAAPSGFSVQMATDTHHLYKPVMIGRISPDGRILPVSVTEGLVPPEPWSPWIGGMAAARRPLEAMQMRKAASR